MTSHNPILDPPRQSPSSKSWRPYPPSPRPHQTRTSSPLRAPKLMLVNGLGEISSMPSPIIGGNSDDELMSPEIETSSQVLQGLSVPSLFDSPVKQNGGMGRYSPTISPMRPPTSPPKRSSSPPKIILETEGKPRPVFSWPGIWGIDCRTNEEDIDINIPFHIRFSYLPQNDRLYLSQLISQFQLSPKSSPTQNAHQTTSFPSSHIPSLSYTSSICPPAKRPSQHSRSSL